MNMFLNVFRYIFLNGYKQSKEKLFVDEYAEI